ncbi:MAG: thiamine phosphate synthase [Minwuia sp.]|nr:thiamine phosphate synthase [Minwuia sp.]
MGKVTSIRSVADMPGRDLPAVIMPTDLSRAPDPVAALSHLPRGSAVILRDAGHPDRAAIGLALRQATHGHQQLLLVSGDMELAARIGADGLHLPESTVGSAPFRTWRRQHPAALVTAACHSLPAVRRAELAGADMALLSPVFPTASHPGGAALGPYRATAIAQATHLPVLAMGGIDRRTCNRLPPVFSGFAAIGLFSHSR